MTPTQDTDQLAMTLLGLHRIATPAGSTAGQQTPVYTITLCEQRLQMLQAAAGALLHLARRTEELTLYVQGLEHAMRAAANAQTSCAWTFDSDVMAWRSSCGHAWVFNDGGPSDNGVRHCHNCGRVVDAQEGGAG